MNNPQFHFLKPTHSMFMFFTSLADAYSKVLMPPKGFTGKLRDSVADMTTVLDCCLHRLEWELSQEQARQKAENEIEQERLQMAIIGWHDFFVVETIDFLDDEDEDLPPPVMLEEVIRRSKMSTMEEEEIVEPGKEVELEMGEEEIQLVEEGTRAAPLEENGDMSNSEVKPPLKEQELPMRLVKIWKRPKERIPAERGPTRYVVSPITGELILIDEISEHMRVSLIDPKYKEQKERMFATFRETTLAADDEISRNIMGLAQACPDLFVLKKKFLMLLKAKIGKQLKQVIWDGHTGSIGLTASRAVSQNTAGEDQNDAITNDARNLPGPRPPLPKPGMPSVRPLPPPPGLALDIPRPSNTVQYPTTSNVGVVASPPHWMPVVNMIPSIRPPSPPMPMMHSQPVMVNQQPMHLSMPLSSSGIPFPPPPGLQFTPLGSSRYIVSLPMSQPGMPMVPPPPMVQGIPPPPPLKGAPPPLPEEPKPKRQKLDDSVLIPEEQFLAQHSGPACINISVPKVDEGNLKGQVLEITVQSLSETVGSLKERIACEIQLPANKQKLSGKTGFLKDNLPLTSYNIAPGDCLPFLLGNVVGGRKR